MGKNGKDLIAGIIGFAIATPRAILAVSIASLPLIVIATAILLTRETILTLISEGASGFLAFFAIYLGTFFLEVVWIFVIAIPIRSKHMRN